MKSAKAVRPMTTYAHSDGTSDDLIGESRCAQGNISNPVANVKLWHKQQDNVRVGGTPNLIRAMFGMPANAKLCKVVTRDIVAVNPTSFDKQYTDGTIDRPFNKPEVTTTVAPQAADFDMAYVLRQCERRDITVAEYFAAIGITL